MYLFELVFLRVIFSWLYTQEWNCGSYGAMLSHSVMSNSLRLIGLQHTRILSPWDFSGKNTGVGCHFLLQGIFPTPGSHPHLLCLLLGSLGHTVVLFFSLLWFYFFGHATWLAGSQFPDRGGTRAIAVKARILNTRSPGNFLSLVF